MLFEGGEAFPALVHDGAVCVPGFAMQLEGNDAILPQRQLPRFGEGGLGIFMLALADLKFVPGLGHRRVAGIRAALTERLGRQLIRVLLQAKAPPVALLLDVDREYREKTEAGSLRLIAPKRFNPTGEAWLPVFHTARGHWRFTALFSNTRKAHELGKTKDWVVIYAYRDTEPESQSTIVTERRGSLSGRRVVRGREEECGLYYRAMEAGSLASIPSAEAEGVSKIPAGSCG